MSVNHQIADLLRQAADLLQQQGANPFRAGAYRRAARRVESLERSVSDIAVEQGLAGLMSIPDIGPGIAGAIHEIVRSGRWSRLDRLRGTLDAVHLFQAIPGVGPRLAQRIYDKLELDTLEGLEAAAYDGRLKSVPGMGARRIAAIRAILSKMLGRVRALQAEARVGPEVVLLLDVDREYREKSQEGALPVIAPRRFNPENKAWLPILHTRRGSWNFTVLYSNTALAHELGRTQDWVIIYFYDQDHREGQHTVVTEPRGALAGRRVVRGRESECRSHYGIQEEPARVRRKQQHTSH
ncbi:MAG: DNA-binding protein [Acidobacteria bacterium]|nr:DNA-binding protein [Acidobacteriota bacterium]